MSAAPFELELRTKAGEQRVFEINLNPVTIYGGLLFMANATTYVDNVPFQAKMALLVLAGLNMGFFQFVTFRGVAAWDDRAATGAARWAGITSLVLWTGIVTFGRWIGFV